VALEVGAGADGFHGDGGLLDEGDELGEPRVVSEADGPVGAADGAAAVDDGEEPGGVVDDAEAEVLDLLGGGEGSVEEGEEDGDLLGFCEVEGLGAVEAEADAMVGLGKVGEEVVEGFAGPVGEVDGEGAGGGWGHGVMVLRNIPWKTPRGPCADGFPQKRDGYHCFPFQPV
jgi:hypothetical protein